MELPIADRPAYLDQACAGDEELRQEVESLLSAYQQAEAKFLKAPALEMAAQQLAAQKDRSLIGQVFSHYSVISVLGVGGMGEVYLARDTELNRKVALKFLPAQFTQDETRIKRFQREAKAASALNHPNIITIYEIGQIENKHFIASEYIEGQTLREVITSGRVAEKDALEIAMQICSALAAAHEAGIIHRDIKPENIMLRRDGYVKVLDFGLVKLTELERSAERTNPTDAAEADPAKTNPGTVLGTAKYMSPEQAMGREVDRRSDIFSLGVTLYELLLGVPPFKGDRMAGILDAIIHHQPVPPTTARPDLDAELDQIITRALEKDREHRYQSANDLRTDLKRLQQKLNSLETNPLAARQTRGEPVNTPPKRNYAPAAIVLALLALVTAVGSLWGRFSGEKDSLADWANAEHRELTEFSGTKTAPTLSPDGQAIVYARKVNGQYDLFRQRVDGKSTQNLTAHDPAENSDPAFSPDGKYLAFRSERDDGGIYLIGATGENERLVVKGGFNPSWSLDGSEILYSTQRGSSVFQRVGVNGQIWAINWQTGIKRRIPAGPDAVQPRISPNGLRIAYWGLKNSAQRDIWTIPAAGGDPVPITDDAADDFCPVWAPDGRHLYFSSNRSGRLSLWRVRIDEATGKSLDVPQPLPIQTQQNQLLTISRDGKLMAYASRLVKTNIRRAAFDPIAGKIIGAPEWVTQMTRRASNQDVSPDGQSLTYYSFGDPQMDIYVSPIGETDNYKQLTDDRVRDRAPRWSPDGKRIAFFSDLSGVFEIWSIRPDGGDRQQLTFSQPKEPGYLDPAWSPDGTRMLFTRRGGGQSYIMDLRQPFQQQTLFAFPKPGNGNSFTAYTWSPDGNRIAGTEWLDGNDISGIVVYDLATQQYTRLNDSGDNPYWLPDNRRLVYLHRFKIFLLDSQTKTSRLLLAPEGEDTFENPTFSRDGRWLYYGVTNNEESIYLISLK
ncbi:MAG: serine/threonine-protein kinase [Acidobacteria bacterium]|nr:serine/threonine-protein kinase [Acidobacteriota bacterium]